ncbi:S-layer protein [Sporomusa termitida]|uniref:Uncharacterized protein n=1 Tax=Sporomusa termitida TaxID=2377 RepID=A0A517DQY2_9FIRM|nr:S-layer protein [Sporomusa termitida]QDR79727.1 hypothetical protein SPTER_10220 [Sporomusa termitida]
MKKLVSVLLAITALAGVFTGNPGSDKPAGRVYAAKAVAEQTDFAYGRAPLTASSIAAAAATGNNKEDNTGIGQQENPHPGDIDPATYASLIDELMQIGHRRSHPDHKMNIDGEIRLHYAQNSGPGRWDRDAAGIRTRLGFNADIFRDWRAYGLLDGQKSISNYNNRLSLARLYVTGTIGTTALRAGSFGYLMAEGNVYDSGFDGARLDFGGPVKYTLSYGETNDTIKTYVATARYQDFDYNLEAGVYHYQTDSSIRRQTTIRTLSGNYNFSNFGLGAMVLDSSVKDNRGEGIGYVFSLNYGDLKTWRPGTYRIFYKYYNQPQGTYIAHQMNGRGNSMQGFKGQGAGLNYTLAENLVGGIEYYDLTDKISGEKGETWWSHITHYF